VNVPAALEAALADATAAAAIIAAAWFSFRADSTSFLMVSASM
jgi:hypothetical protein